MVKSIKLALVYNDTLNTIVKEIGKKPELTAIKTDLEKPENLLAKDKRSAPLLAIVDELLKSLNCSEASVEFRRIMGEIATNPSAAGLKAIGDSLATNTLLSSEDKTVVQNIIVAINGIHASAEGYAKILKLISLTLQKKKPRGWSIVLTAIGALDPADPVRKDLEVIVKTLSSNDTYSSLVGELLDATTKSDIPAALTAFKGKVDSPDIILEQLEKDHLKGIAQFILGLFSYKTRYSQLINAVRSITTLFTTGIPAVPAGTDADAHVKAYFTGKFTEILSAVVDTTDNATLKSMTDAIIPSAKNCGSFIASAVAIAVLSAKKALYKEMVEHMQLMMNKMGKHVNQLKDLLDPADLDIMLNAPMDPNYNEAELVLSKQKGVATFDIGINRLIDYLHILDNNYKQWIRCICKNPGETWSPKKKTCCPAGHTVDPATGDCKIVGCTGGKVRQADGSCECPDGTLEINGVCTECHNIPGHALDDTGKCVKCDDPNENFNGHCVPKCPPGHRRAPDGSCEPIPPPPSCPSPKVGIPPNCTCPSPQFDGENSAGTCIKCNPGENWVAASNQCVSEERQLELEPAIQEDLMRHLADVIDTYSGGRGTTAAYPEVRSNPANRDLYRMFPNDADFNQALASIKIYGSRLMTHATANLNSILMYTGKANKLYPLIKENMDEKGINADISIELIRKINEIYMYMIKSYEDKTGDAKKALIKTGTYKLIQGFMILYKIANNYISKLVCKDNLQLSSQYIDAIYNVFNKRIVYSKPLGKELLAKSTSDNKGVLDKLFNPSSDINNFNSRKGDPEIGGILTKFFKFYASLHIKYNTTNQRDFWPDIRDKIDWTNYKNDKDSLQYYVAHMNELGLEKTSQSGGRLNTTVGPDDIPHVLAQQVAWETMNKEYNSLEPEYQQMLPEPEPAPVHSLTEPIHRFIDEFADEDPLEEARQTLGLLAPHEVDDLFTNDKGTMDRIKPLYAKAIPSAKDEWIPILVRADSLRTLL